MDERGVAGEEGGAGGTGIAKSGVQAAQSLARTGNAGDEQDHSCARGAGLGNRLEDRVRGAGQILLIGVGGGNIGNAVAAVEHAGGLDDGRHRPVGGGDPILRIERVGRRGQGRREPVQKAGQRLRIGIQHRQRTGQCEGKTLRTRVGGGRHQDRHDGRAPAAGMEILQIQRVILHLLAPCIIEMVGAGLELQHQHGARGEDDRIGAPAEPQQRIFQKHPPILGPRQGGAQHVDADLPGAKLLHLVAPEMADLRLRQRADDGAALGCQKGRGRAGPERRHACPHFDTDTNTETCTPPPRRATRRGQNCCDRSCSERRVGRALASHQMGRRVGRGRLPGTTSPP
jgi:hypothetical protein